MARFTFRGLEEYESKLNRLAEFREIGGKAVYEGAKIVADEVRAEIDSLPTVDHRKRGSDENKLQGITSAQKKGLQESFGITPIMETAGYYHVKLGFAGYNSVETEQFPQGQPNIVVARSLHNGASFRQKNPFMSRAFRRVRDRAEKKMAETIDEEIRKVMEGD